MYEIIGKRAGMTTVMDTAKTKKEAVELCGEYHHAFASDKILAGEYNIEIDWQINLRKKGKLNDKTT